EITSAAVEQSSGIGQVNEAVTQMDQVTQQNAALVEEAAAAASSLREQAVKLTEAVSVFRIDGSKVPPARPVAATPRTPGPARAPASKPRSAALATARPAQEEALAAASGDWSEF
ncbi:MAG: methyl-accepting chemotaxis protein, partial [Burkholderiales bacterium]|nr:methyl-accepting chemotaxis protein [Burkholderiales bacterium]